MRNATVTVSPRLALVVINVLGVIVRRLENQIEDPTHPPTLIPGFDKPYRFEDSTTSRNLIAEFSGLRMDLFNGSVDNALLEALEDLRDLDDFLNQ